MFQFIITDIVMLSLGTLLYIVARSLPRIEEDRSEPKAHSLVDRLIHSEVPHKIDMALNAYAGKFFRKLKVFLMRLDNYLTEKLKKIHTNGNGGGKQKIDFKDITGGDSAGDTSA